MEPPRGRRWKRVAFACGALSGVALLVGLGVWQLQRLAWKRELVARVEQRVNAPAVDLSAVAALDVAELEYRRVRTRGHFLNDRETLVQAATRLGGGYWVMTPLVSEAGVTVLVNRGFVETARRAARDWARVEGAVQVTGLVRRSEPGGGFLRDNQPQAGRWYSRDVAALARRQGLGNVAPFFIDAEAAARPLPGGPVAGLTVVTFTDNHLQYALTWFALALLLAAGAVWVFREELRLGKLSPS